jgi:hypothetical protein
MVWRWASSQQLKGFVFPSGEHQYSEEELCAKQKLYFKGPMSHELTWMDLEHFPLSGAPLSTYLYRYL